MIHRYAMLGVLDEKGFPLREMGILQAPQGATRPRVGDAVAPMAGAPCPECGNQHADPQGRLRLLSPPAAASARAAEPRCAADGGAVRGATRTGADPDG